MTNYILPTELTAPLSDEVARYIPTYTPTALTPAQWRQAAVPVWELGARCLPTSRNEAKVIMSIVCAYLAWTDQVAGSVEPSTVLTQALADRYLRTAITAQASSTQANVRGKLLRALRAQSGEAPVAARKPRTTGPAPYQHDDLELLASAAAESAPLAAAFALALTDGLVLPNAHGAALPDHSTAATAARAIGVDAAWTQVIPSPSTFTRTQWEAARQAAQAADVVLFADRLRATWVRHHVEQSAPIARTASTHRLTRADLDNVVSFLTTPQAPFIQACLRG